MTTAKVDSRRRVRLSATRPGQVFSVEPGPNGVIVLTPLKAEAKERFPKGSLLKYFTGDLGRKRDQEETAIASGVSKGLREDPVRSLGL